MTRVYMQSVDGWMRFRQCYCKGFDFLIDDLQFVYGFVIRPSISITYKQPQPCVV